MDKTARQRTLSRKLARTLKHVETTFFAEQPIRWNA